MASEFLRKSDGTQGCSLEDRLLNINLQKPDPTTIRMNNLMRKKPCIERIRSAEGDLLYRRVSIIIVIDYRYI